MVWPTFPGQGGLSVGKDLKIQVSYSVCILILKEILEPGCLFFKASNKETF